MSETLFHTEVLKQSNQIFINSLVQKRTDALQTTGEYL